MRGLFAAFAPSGIAPAMLAPDAIDTVYRRHRFRIMVAITAG